MISIVREDNTRQKQGCGSPFIRIQATWNELTVSSSDVSATFPSTIYEEGVLFIRTTRFRQLLRMTRIKEQFLAFQITAEGLRFGDVLMPFEGSDIVLYPNPADAPESWPPPPPEAEQLPEKKQATLFEMEEE